jgi:hypothetical protein
LTTCRISSEVSSNKFRLIERKELIDAGDKRAASWSRFALNINSRSKAFFKSRLFHLVT